MVIHSYPTRSYRDPESLEDVWIKIPVRYCGQAKALGRQYTKRRRYTFMNRRTNSVHSTPLGRLEELLDRQEEAHLRAGGGRSGPPSLRTLLQAGNMKLDT